MDENSCVHHWIIEVPQGPISKGRCKKCGAERDFPNSSHFWGFTEMNLDTDKDLSDRLLGARKIPVV